MHDNNHAATTQASLVQTPTQAQASALPATAATEELYLGLKFTTFIPIAAISASGLFCVVVLMAWCTSIGTKKRKKRQDKEHARQAAVIRGSDPDELEKPLSGRSDSSVRASTINPAFHPLTITFFQLPASDGDYSFPQRNYEGCDYYTGHQNVHVRVKSEPDHQARSAALQSAPPPRPKTRAHTKVSCIYFSTQHTGLIGICRECLGRSMITTNPPAFVGI